MTLEMNVVAVLDGLPNLIGIGTKEEGMFNSFHPVAKNAGIECWYMPSTKLKTSRKTIMGKSP
jgi:hypothetical protein